MRPDDRAGEPPLPNYLIIGAQKSGTTTLRASLDAHPEACCAREIHFFDLNYERGIDWYRRHFATANGFQVIGEKCPDYMPNPKAMERIALDLPGVRLIAILRNPVDRAYSNYWHERRIGRERLSFAAALGAEAERARAYEEGACPFAYADRGRYLVQLQRICELFPRDRLLVLLFEELRDDPSGVFPVVCRFLGIDPSVAPAELAMRVNPYRAHRPEWLWHLMNRKRLWRRLPPRVAARLARMMEGEATYVPMDEVIRRRLLEVYAEDNAALAAWLGRDLSAWGS